MTAQYRPLEATKRLTIEARISPISAISRIDPSFERSRLVIHPSAAMVPNMPAVMKNVPAIDAVV